MPSDVQVGFSVSCSSPDSPGFDHTGTRWWVLSVQWPGMAKPEYLWIPLRGKKNEDGTPRDTDRSGDRDQGQGDDTHDVARAAAGAFYSSFGMGDIPREHLDDVDIEVDQDPPQPGNTNGRIILRGVSHVDTGATDGKLFLKLYLKPVAPKIKITISRLPKPTRTPDRRGWRTWRLPMPDRPKWPEDGGGWKRVPIRPEFRQFSTRGVPAPGVIRIGTPSELPPPWQPPPGGLPPWDGPIEAPFPFDRRDPVQQARDIAVALRGAGIDAEWSGASVEIRPTGIDGERRSAMEVQIGTGLLSHDENRPFPWNFAIDLDPERNWGDPVETKSVAAVAGEFAGAEPHVAGPGPIAPPASHAVEEAVSMQWVAPDPGFGSGGHSETAGDGRSVSREPVSGSEWRSVIAGYAKVPLLRSADGTDAPEGNRPAPGDLLHIAGLLDPEGERVAGESVSEHGAGLDRFAKRASASGIASGWRAPLSPRD